jgi:hypothetical protein
MIFTPRLILSAPCFVLALSMTQCRFAVIVRTKDSSLIRKDRDGRGLLLLAWYGHPRTFVVANDLPPPLDPLFDAQQHLALHDEHCWFDKEKERR